VESAGKYAKFWLDPVSLARSVGYTPHDLRRLHELVQENRSSFEEKWHEYFGS
jgi:hypothetical protein